MPEQPDRPAPDLRLLSARVESPLLTADARLGTRGMSLRVGPARISLPGPALLAAAAGAAVATVAEAPVALVGAAAVAFAYRKRLGRLLPTVSLFDTSSGPGGAPGRGRGF